MRKPLRIFVATGTGPPFPRLLDAVRSLANEPNVELFVQRGSAGPSFSDLPGEDFISREAFARELHVADIVISHAGAGAIYEACVAGHVPILVPRLPALDEIVNDHQIELSTTLANAHKAILCDDLEKLPALVQSAKKRGEPISIEPKLIEAVRKELLTPSPNWGRFVNRPYSGKKRSPLRNTWRLLASFAPWRFK